MMSVPSTAEMPNDGAYQLVEACLVQQMTAIRNVTWISRCMYISQAYRAIWTWYIFHTLPIPRRSREKKSTQSLIGNLILQDKKNTLTRCPFVFNCNGKHILHTWQWKKLLRPPIRQIPHPSQWYWSLSSSSNRLQIKHVYCKSPENGQKWHISL